LDVRKQLLLGRGGDTARRLAVLITICSCLTACGNATSPTKAASSCHPVTGLPESTAANISGVARAGVFFAQLQSSVSSHPIVLEAYSLADGHDLGTVSVLPAWPVDVNGPVRARDGSLWYTMAFGPCERSGLAGGDPAPNSCAGTIVRADPRTRKTTVEWRSPSSLGIGGAVPSPDGHEVVYVAGGCDTGYFNQHLVVRELASGEEWSIGAMATACHWLTPASWSADGKRLIFTFGPSTLPTNSSFVPHGTCEGWSASQIAIAPAAGTSEIDSTQLVKARSGCQYVQAVFDHDGVAAIETCGEPAAGPTSLVQLDSHLTVTARFDLAPGSDPTSLALSQDGKLVLVDEYQAPYTDASGSRVGPYDWIEEFDGAHLRFIDRKLETTSGIRQATY
jgi:hypothetical protein